MTVTDPFDRLPDVPTFSLTSSTVQDGAEMPVGQMSGVLGGQDISPQLSWSGAPAETKSYAVQVFDPDGPTMSGFRHWAVMDIPASVTELEAGAGAEDGGSLPEGAIQLPNDARMPRYIGGAPPEGTGRHRYVIVVTALDVEHLDVPADGTPAFMDFSMAGHTLARAAMTPWARFQG